MRILITGGRGYLGSVLVPMLLAAGHEVVSVERSADTRHPAPEHLRLSRLVTDIRAPEDITFEGVDAAICLAAVPNRSSLAESSRSADLINRDASVRLARAARAGGVRRFLFASSCSVYGTAMELIDESGPVIPLTPYASAKAEAEHQLMELADARFSVLSLRLATLFGPSPRLRRDLLVNGMVWAALTRGAVTMPQPGLRRPLVHVRDAAEAFMLCLPEPRGGTGSAAILNVAGLNTTTDHAAQYVADRLGVPTRPERTADDGRSYWVANGLFEKTTGKERWWGLAEGVEELRTQMASRPAGVSTHRRRWSRGQGRSDPVCSAEHSTVAAPVHGDI